MKTEFKARKKNHQMVSFLKIYTYFFQYNWILNFAKYVKNVIQIACLIMSELINVYCISVYVE